MLESTAVKGRLCSPGGSILTPSPEMIPLDVGGWDACPDLRASLGKPANVLLENMLIEEQQRHEGLVLGGGGDVPFDGKIGQELLHLLSTHVPRVTLAVKKNAAFYPAEIGFFHP